MEKNGPNKGDLTIYRNKASSKCATVAMAGGQVGCLCNLCCIVCRHRAADRSQISPLTASVQHASCQEHLEMAACMHSQHDMAFAKQYAGLCPAPEKRLAFGKRGQYHRQPIDDEYT